MSTRYASLAAQHEGGPREPVHPGGAAWLVRQGRLDLVKVVQRHRRDHDGTDWWLIAGTLPAIVSAERLIAVPHPRPCQGGDHDA